MYYFSPLSVDAKKDKIRGNGYQGIDEDFKEKEPLEIVGVVFADIVGKYQNNNQE
jgi:hypothetical protein